MTRRVVVALGANLGDRIGNLRRAVDGLPGVVSYSYLYETSPVGGPSDQPPYLNAVIMLDTAVEARELLVLGQRLEREAGRQDGPRWSPRELDVDIIWIDGETIDEPDLIVPHARASERAFVLVPLSDVAPELVAVLAPDGIPPGRVNRYPGELA